MKSQPFPTDPGPRLSANSRPPQRAPAALRDGIEAGVKLDLDEVMPAFEKLVADTLVQVEACPPKSDTTFEGYEGLLAAIRSATTLEGVLLERGIELVARANPDLVVVQLERPLPVHEAAKAVFRRNDWSRASGLRLDSEVLAREFYKPDILVVDRARLLALIIDVKRSVSSYKPRTLAELRSRMMSSALVVRDVLERDHDAPPVARADIAIIDAAGDCRDEAKGIFALADLDWMLRIEGAAEAITRLRALFGTGVRALLDRHCEAIVGPRLEQRRVTAHNRAANAAGSHSGEVAGTQHYRMPNRAADGIDDEAAAIADADDNDGEFDAEGDTQPADLLRSGAPTVLRTPRPRIAVGIASREMH